MRKSKTFIAWVLALVMIFGLLPGGITQAVSGDPAKGDIVIVYTNDIHCGVDQIKDADGKVTNIGYAGVAAYKEEMEALAGEENVTLLDAGDAVQGDAIGTMSKGEYLTDIMNQAGYDIFVPGNHEFDYGMERMQYLMGQLDAKVISSNFADLKNNKLVYDPYTIITYGEGQNAKKVAYVGITTPESFTKSTPSYFQNEKGEYIYGFKEGNNGKDLYNAVQSAVDAAKTAGADYVIAVGHLGIDEQSSPWRSTDVIANTRGIDAFIDGHSHSTVVSQVVKNKEGKDIILTQTGTKLANIGRMIIEPDGSITTDLVAGYAKQNDETAAFIKNIENEFAADLAENVGKTDVALTVNDPATGNRSVRSLETNLGDLAADAYRYVLGNGRTGSESAPADIAFVNGGGVRANIDSGEISFGEVIAVHPFNNVGCVVEAKGQEILDALEMAARVAPAENGGFLQVSGLSYTIDTSIPSTVVVDDKKNFVEVAGARRVKDVKVGGKAIDVNKTYTLASHNYMLLDGGDGINMFRDNNVVVQPVVLDNQILISYIQNNLKGTVGQEYSNPYGQGRIQVKDGTQESKGIKFETVVTSAGEPSTRITLPSEGKETVVRIPVPNANSATAAYLVKADGTEEIIGKSVAAGSELLLTVSNSATVRIRQNGKSFADSKNHWASDAISFVTARNLIPGTSESNFSPDTAMTRGMMVSILHKLENSPKNSAQPFKDVLPGKYYSEAVAWAAQNNIVKGTGSGFQPESNITREQIAMILYNYAKPAQVNGSLENFSDSAAVSSWAAEAMRWAVGTGVLSGEGGKLNPGKSATRAEVATIIQKLLTNTVK